VTGIVQDTIFNGTAAPVAGMRVSFSTSSGYTGSVFVPDSVFADKSAVTQLIEGEVKKVAVAQGIAGTISG
jgi:hypothetical protein